MRFFLFNVIVTNYVCIFRYTLLFSTDLVKSLILCFINSQILLNKEVDIALSHFLRDFGRGFWRDQSPLPMSQLAFRHLVKYRIVDERKEKHVFLFNIPTMCRKEVKLSQLSSTAIKLKNNFNFSVH